MRRLLVSIATIALGCVAAQADEASPEPAKGLFGSWKFDAALTAQPPGSTPADAATPAASGTGGRHGAHAGGMGHGAGMGGGGGMGGGAGGHGGRHGGSPDTSTRHTSAALGEADDERGLARTRATQLTISAIAQRIRFDDGEHAIELPRDGMNASGAGIGGTVAMSALAPDIVVETLTDAGTSLSERYHLSDDGKHLELHMSLKRADAEQPLEFVRVFDRNDEASPAQ
jgi:hypothetical protein